MITNVVKTIGLCIASLNSFNVQTQQNELLETATIIRTGIINPYTLNSSYQYQEGGTDIEAMYSSRHGTLTTTNMTVNYYEVKQQTYFTDTQTVDPRTYTSPTEPKKYYKNANYIILKITNSNNVIAYTKINNLKEQLEFERAGYDNPLTVKTDFKYFSTQDSIVENYMQAITNPNNKYEVSNRQINLLNLNNTQIYENKIITDTANSTVTTKRHDLYDDLNVQKETNTPLYIIMMMNIEGNQTLDYLSWEYEDIGVLMSTSNAVVEQEVIDVPGLCFEVLTMPFTFISTAFNLTIFPGTPYQINISNLFLSIIGILIFVFIMKKLIFK